MDSLPYSFRDDHRYMNRSFYFNQKYPFQYDNLGIITNSAQPLIDLSDHLPYELYIRFMELLPTDSLRRFMYTSKNNYINGVVTQGILVRRLLFCGNQRNKCNEFGELVVIIRNILPEKPIYKFFDVTIAACNVKDFSCQSYNYFRRTYESLEIRHSNLIGFYRLFHPGIKHLYFNIQPGDNDIVYTLIVIFNTIKGSNVSTIYVKEDSMDRSEVPRTAEGSVKVIQRSGYTGDLLLLLRKDFSVTCYSLALRWHRGVMYAKRDYYPNSPSCGFTPSMANMDFHQFNYS